LSTDEGLRDAYQERLHRLVEYDRRRGTELLDTLEGYLDHRGSVVATSRALYIHPNTLRQRLDRIERASGIEVDRDDWLSLAVATKVVKLETLRLRRGAGKNEEGGGNG
jgi:DNA-binding PucR family transcriptional regulator